jgi:hypothetical protein
MGKGSTTGHCFCCIHGGLTVHSVVHFLQKPYHLHVHTCSITTCLLFNSPQKPPKTPHTCIYQPHGGYSLRRAASRDVLEMWPPLQNLYRLQGHPRQNLCHTSTTPGGQSPCFNKCTCVICLLSEGSLPAACLSLLFSIDHMTRSSTHTIRYPSFAPRVQGPLSHHVYHNF